MIFGGCGGDSVQVPDRGRKPVWSCVSQPFSRQQGLSVTPVVVGIDNKSGTAEDFRKVPVALGCLAHSVGNLDNSVERTVPVRAPLKDPQVHLSFGWQEHCGFVHKYPSVFLCSYSYYTEVSECTIDGGLHVYKTILFDIDGVMLSEERYFDASALTVYELLTSPRYLNLSVSGLPPFSVNPSEAEIQAIRTVVFADDAVLDWLKSMGVNSNWDMVYLQFAYQWSVLLDKARQDRGVWTELRSRLADGCTPEVCRQLGEVIPYSLRQLSTDTFAAVRTAFAHCQNPKELFSELENRFASSLEFSVDTIQERLRTIWKTASDAFQEWYLGDDLSGVKEATGKAGFVQSERAIVPPFEFADLLKFIAEQGATIGIGTGRPFIETDVPLTALGWRQHFADARITTAREVLDAEARYPKQRPLTKPHPFSYVRSWLGTGDAGEALRVALPLPLDEGRALLVVGDSVADWKAARTMGCHFAAVLTGLGGESVRSQFEQLGCEYIFRDVLELRSLFSP